ncbi:hypothetical protein [Roseateles sp.]|uniref:hypothetical protein n=1 Tax=Roseateles sp. TaxID=1971397 RepID=UPI003BA96263
MKETESNKQKHQGAAGRTGEVLAAWLAQPSRLPCKPKTKIGVGRTKGFIQ